MFEFGDVLGPDKRYKVVRKLGWGMNSSIWMAIDEKYALSRITHIFFNRGITWELTTLQHIASLPPLPGFKMSHLPQLLSHFVHPGREQDGDHLCLVTTLLRGGREASPEGGRWQTGFSFASG